MCSECDSIFATTLLKKKYIIRSKNNITIGCNCTTNKYKIRIRNKETAYSRDNPIVNSCPMTQTEKFPRRIRPFVSSQMESTVFRKLCKYYIDINKNNGDNEHIEDNKNTNIKNINNKETVIISNNNIDKNNIIVDKSNNNDHVHIGYTYNNTPNRNSTTTTTITTTTTTATTVVPNVSNIQKTCEHSWKCICVNDDKKYLYVNGIYKKKTSDWHNGKVFLKGSINSINCYHSNDCYCLTYYKEYCLHSSSKTDANQIHCDILNIIILYLYQQQILPDVNELKRKINKYVPSCRVIIANFLKICENDHLNRFYICNFSKRQKYRHLHSQLQLQSDLQLPPLEENKTIYRPENICIFLKGIPNVFLNEVDEDTDNITKYIPTVFIHLLDRFRFQNGNSIHKGGRYILAESLKQTGPYCFRVMALGRIIRILQKCFDLNILSYSNNNNIIPIFTSESVSQTYLTKIKMDKSPYLRYKKEQYTNLVKSRIKKLFKKFVENDYKFEESYKRGFALSVLPRAYKNTYGEDLNMEKLGYTKLNEFITNELSDVCYVSSEEKFQCKLIINNGEKIREWEREVKLQKHRETNYFLHYMRKCGWFNRISFFYSGQFYRSDIKDIHTCNIDTNYVWETLYMAALYIENVMHRRSQEEETQWNKTNSLQRNAEKYKVMEQNYLQMCGNPSSPCNINNGVHRYNKGRYNEKKKVSILLPLDTTLPSSYDGRTSYRNSPTYYCTAENEDTTTIKFLEPQTEYDLIHDIKKNQGTDIHIEENITLYTIYKSAYVVYSSYHLLFDDCDADLSHHDKKIYQ